MSRIHSSESSKAGNDSFGTGGKRFSSTAATSFSNIASSQVQNDGAILALDLAPIGFVLFV